MSRAVSQKFFISVVLSTIIHLLLFYTILNVNLMRKQKELPDVYQVDLLPAARRTIDVEISGRMQGSSRELSFNPIDKREELSQAPPEISPFPQSDMKASALAPMVNAAPPPREGNRTMIVSWGKQVKSLIDSRWQEQRLAQTVNKTLKCTYILEISRNGELLNKRLLSTSGNIPFDQSILRAMENAGRMPAPPTSCMAGQENISITMTFTPPQ